jgi:hypothetical protein
MTLMASNALQKEVLFNEALVILDTLVHPSAVSRTQTTPPGSPTLGVTYIVPPSGATGAWAGQANKIAVFLDAWRFFDPVVGMLVYVESASNTVRWTGTDWTPAITEISGLAAVPDVDIDPGDLVTGYVLTYDAVSETFGLQPVATPSLTLLDLTDTPSDYTGQAGKILVVNSTEDGVEFDDAPSGGAEDFLDLTDTPGSYSGHGNKLVAVNSGETALEFVDAPSALPTTTSNASKILRVNSAETGVEWVEDITTSTVSSSRDLTNTDFSGGKTLLVDSGSAVALNIPSGLTRTSPVLIVRQGTGTVTVTAGGGVTLNSADGNVALRVRYSSASIIPVGTNSYILVGDLA